uniref:EF_assoc_2 domain-containing protein n=1 Tax=Glossina austeni TaxID=7395 RepID=A0A1A9V118_GLOAU
MLKERDTGLNKLNDPFKLMTNFNYGGEQLLDKLRSDSSGKSIIRATTDSPLSPPHSMDSSSNNASILKAKKRNLINAGQRLVAKSNVLNTRGRNETTLAVLRRFGYDEQSEVCKDYLWLSLKIPQNYHIEVNNFWWHYLNAMIKIRWRFIASLSQEHRMIFSTCPSLSSIFIAVYCLDNPG